MLQNATVESNAYHRKLEFITYNFIVTITVNIILPIRTELIT
jgi:hypothetical protein